MLRFLCNLFWYCDCVVNTIIDKCPFVLLEINVDFSKYAEMMVYVQNPFGRTSTLPNLISIRERDCSKFQHQLQEKYSMLFEMRSSLWSSIYLPDSTCSWLTVQFCTSPLGGPPPDLILDMFVQLWIPHFAFLSRPTFPNICSKIWPIIARNSLSKQPIHLGTPLRRTCSSN